MRIQLMGRILATFSFGREGSFATQARSGRKAPVAAKRHESLLRAEEIEEAVLVLLEHAEPVEELFQLERFRAVLLRLLEQPFDALAVGGVGLLVLLRRLGRLGRQRLIVVLLDLRAGNLVAHLLLDA